MPLVSVVIITYNRAKYIMSAIESALEQDYQNLEIIVIDDASQDGTREILQSYIDQGKIKYYKNDKNQGIVYNRNRGLNLSSGKYIAVLDSDDLWCDKEKIKKQAEFLENNNEYALIGGNVVIINGDGDSTGEIIYETDNEKICIYPFDYFPAFYREFHLPDLEQCEQHGNHFYPLWHALPFRPEHSGICLWNAYHLQRQWCDR